MITVKKKQCENCWVEHGMILLWECTYCHKIEFVTHGKLESPENIKKILENK